jgi:putative FmdB family regulatory protein
MKRIYEFRCVKDHTTERFVDSEVKSIECPHCRNEASRIISSPRIQLEGITGAFPTAYDAWARKHEQAARVANKRED